MSVPSPPSAMRAWQYSSTKGGLEKNLAINPSAPLPKSKPDHHLVQVIATALNPIDYKLAEIPGVVHFIKPATPGIDYAGTIVTPASGSSLKAGQLVFGAAGSTPAAAGGLAEFAGAPAKATVPLPEGVDPIHGATICVAGLTAYQSIVPHVKAGDKVFINGGSGGTGIFGIQFAKVAGCHVTTSCSTPNVELCKSLGADRVVDYKKEGVIEALRASGHKFDHAVDNVGKDSDLLWQSHTFMKPGAVMVAVAGEPSLSNVVDSLKRKLIPTFLGGLKGKVIGFYPDPSEEHLTQIAEWIKSGKVKPIIDHKYQFEEAVQAVERLKTGRARGKIVIDVASKTYSKR